MSTRRKISVRKIVQTLVTLVAVSGCVLAIMSADRQHSMRRISKVQLRVQSPGGVHFLTEDAVRNMLFTARHINPYKLGVAQLDERAMEAILHTNPWVSEAQVYTDAERVMHIMLTQRVPVVRVFEADGNSYYLDTALQAMPLSSQYTHYTPIVTGVPQLRNDSVGNAMKGTIIYLIRYISLHPFWNAQVSQVEMLADGGFELIPVLGRQRIIIGDTSRLADKLDNLFAFYKQVYSKVGWDRYTSIDLRYDGQIIASPALPWKAPVDKALSNMNWVKAIMDNAPARQNQLGGDATAFADSVGAVTAPNPQRGANTAAPSASPRSPQQGIPHAVKRTTIAPASPAPKKPKPPPDAVQKKPAKPSSKHLLSKEKNTKPHAATNR